MKNQKQAGAVWAAEVPTSAHAVLGRHDFSVVPREQFGVLGKLPTFLWCLLVFSDSDSVILIPHTAQKTCLVFTPLSNLRADQIKVVLIHSNPDYCSKCFKECLGYFKPQQIRSIKSFNAYNYGCN